MRASRLNLVIIVLSLVGLFVAGNLSLSHLLNIELPCGATNDCGKVASDSWSKLAGIPIAYFGFLAYAAFAGLGILRSVQGVFKNLNLFTLSYVMALVGTLGSAALTYHSVVDLHLVCKWCVASAALMTLIFVAHAALWTSGGKGEESVPTFAQDKKVIAIVAALSFFGLGGMVGALKIDQAKAPLSGNIKVEQAFNKDTHFLIGDAKSPVTIIEFGDLMCAACRRHYRDVENAAIQAKGKIRYGFRHFPIENKPDHEYSLLAATVAEMAADKGKFYEFVRATYGEAEVAKSPDDVYRTLDNVNGDAAKAQARLNDPKIDQDPAFLRLMKDKEDAAALGVDATPTFIILVNGRPPVSANWDQLDAWLKAPENVRLIETGGATAQ